MSDKVPTLTVNEIYQSIQGESTFAGLPCVFIRLTFCDLRCSWCDTEYAFYEGNKMSLDEILAEVDKFDCPLVELTGGEPLLQPASPALMTKLLEKGYQVLLETAGHRDISVVDRRVVRIMDLKCPDSGMSDKNRWENIPGLTANDEVKCVIASRADYEWAREKVLQYDLPDKVRAVLFSAVFGKIEPRQIVDWILADKLPVRFQLQMHKFIWDPKKKGV
ncbi:MAG: radical SAM protein [Verrucomicrobiales bacterium]|jgi:7-carboxy-7-deazaguanine synthase|nr:radical SAM protein [Verrucomicrobiales bacterium]